MYTCTVLYLFMDIGQFLYTSLVPRLHPLLCESEFKGHAIMRARGSLGMRLLVYYMYMYTSFTGVDVRHYEYSIKPSVTLYIHLLSVITILYVSVILI